MGAEQRAEDGDGERVLVASRICDACTEQLGRHVEGRSDESEFAVVCSRVFEHSGDRIDGIVPKGEPEVGHADPAVASDHHVVRLEVAMHDASGMRRCETATCGDHDLEDLVG